MTNLIKESATNIINELLDDIKENIIQINDNCMLTIVFLFLFQVHSKDSF
jgi:hypothetical protein